MILVFLRSIPSLELGAPPPPPKRVTQGGGGPKNDQRTQSLALCIYSVVVTSPGPTLFLHQAYNQIVTVPRRLFFAAQQRIAIT
jgi:hypothetical protein